MHIKFRSAAPRIHFVKYIFFGPDENTGRGMAYRHSSNISMVKLIPSIYGFVGTTTSVQIFLFRSTIFGIFSLTKRKRCGQTGTFPCYYLKAQVVSACQVLG